MEISALRGLGPAQLIKRSVKAFIRDDMASYAAALAYQVLFSIFPFLIFLVALLGFLQIPGFFEWLLAQARALLPQQAIGQVQQVLSEVQQQSSGKLLSFGILFTIWTASAGIRSTMNAMNVAYRVEEGCPAWKRYPLSILYTIGLATMIVLAVGFMLISRDVMGWLAQQVSQGTAFVTVWSWARWPIITTYDGRRVLIPNSVLFAGSVIVNTAFEQRRVEYDVGIGYGDDMGRAKALILEALTGVAGVQSAPPPDVLLIDLAPSSVKLRCAGGSGRRAAQTPSICVTRC